MRSLDPIELATDDVAPPAVVDATLDALAGRRRGREGSTTVTDPVGHIIGDHRGLAATQRAPLVSRGIDIAPFALSHLANRVPTGISTSRWTTGHHLVVDGGMDATAIY